MFKKASLLILLESTMIVVLSPIPWRPDRCRVGHLMDISGALLHVDSSIDALRARCFGRHCYPMTCLTDFLEEVFEVCCSSLRVEKVISEETFGMRSTDDRLETYIRYHVSKPTVPTYLLSCCSYFAWSQRWKVTIRIVFILHNRWTGLYHWR